MLRLRNLALVHFAFLHFAGGNLHPELSQHFPRFFLGLLSEFALNGDGIESSRDVHGQLVNKIYLDLDRAPIVGLVEYLEFLDSLGGSQIEKPGLLHFLSQVVIFFEWGRTLEVVMSVPLQGSALVIEDGFQHLELGVLGVGIPAAFLFAYLKQSVDTYLVILELDLDHRFLLVGETTIGVGRRMRAR